MNALSISDDLIFTSRITATGRANGLTILPVRTGDAALRTATLAPPMALIVDLNNPGLKIVELIAGLREVCPEMPRIIGYGSHVDTVTLKAARQAGCDLVMARSKFVKDLEAHLAGWCGDKVLANEGE